MMARIYDMYNGESYVVMCAEECRDGVDRQAYELAFETRETVYCGSIVVEIL